MRRVAGSPAGGRCLDLGCGTGRYRSFIEAAGLEWHGADIVEPDAAHRGRFRLIENDSIPYESECFDVVCLFNVIEHFTNPEPMFAELRRVTAGGGRVYGAVAFHEHEHHSFFHLSDRGLRAILARHGFEIDSLWPSEYSGMVYTCQRFFGGGGRIVRGAGWAPFLSSLALTNACLPFFLVACGFQWLREITGRRRPLADAATIYFAARRPAE
jgi:SAM-dependent methyltransferase